MRLSKTFTKVTPLSKTLALILLIVLPFIGFFLGREYQKTLYPHTRTTPLPLAESNTQNSLPTNDWLHILSPHEGEKLCLGKNYNITWRVPPESESVTLMVAEASNGSTIHEIGNFPTSYQSSEPGKGMFSWNVGFNRDGARLILGPGYHILIRARYQQYELTNSSDYFTITNC